MFNGFSSVLKGLLLAIIQNIYASFKRIGCKLWTLLCKSEKNNEKLIYCINEKMLTEDARTDILTYEYLYGYSE